MKLCLSKCTQNMCIDILCNYYKETYPREEIQKKLEAFTFPTLKYSPLELINMAMQYKDIDSLLDSIFSSDIESKEFVE